jgi:membrane-bound lysozyme inhibitor of c-type lysozyme MliC
VKAPALAGGVVLVLATLAAAAGPSVTCAGARPRSIEALVCGSPLLAHAAIPFEEPVALGLRGADGHHRLPGSGGETVEPGHVRVERPRPGRRASAISTWRASRDCASRAGPPERQTLERAPSASGARYEGAGERTFREHQGEATYRGGAAGPEVRCVPEAIG